MSKEELRDKFENLQRIRAIVGTFAKDFAEYAGLELVDASELQIRAEHLIASAFSAIEKETWEKAANGISNGDFIPVNGSFNIGATMPFIAWAKQWCERQALPEPQPSTPTQEGT